MNSIPDFWIVFSKANPAGAAAAQTRAVRERLSGAASEEAPRVWRKRRRERVRIAILGDPLRFRDCSVRRLIYLQDMIGGNVVQMLHDAAGPTDFNITDCLFRTQSEVNTPVAGGHKSNAG